MDMDGAISMLNQRQLETLRVYFQDEAPLTENDFVGVWNSIHTSTEDMVQSWDQVCENYMDLYKYEPERACEYLIYSFKNGDLPKDALERYTYIIDSYGYIVEQDVMDIIDFHDDDFIQELYEHYCTKLHLDNILNNKA